MPNLNGISDVSVSLFFSGFSHFFTGDLGGPCGMDMFFVDFKVHPSFAMICPPGRLDGIAFSGT